MSNHEEEQFDNTMLPDADEVSTTRGIPSYRIANGALCQGSEKRGNLVTVAKVLGRLVRIGIHEGTGRDDGVWYQQLEADIETNTGTIRVKAPLSNAGQTKPGVSANSFAEGLLDMAKGEVIVIEPGLSKKQNRFGSYTTYGNLFHYDLATRKTRPAARRDRNPDHTIEEQWEALAAELREHPAYEERKTEEDATTHRALLSAECKAKGWPTPDENPSGYQELARKCFSDEFLELKDLTEDDWGLIRQDFNQPNAVCPPMLLPKAASGVRRQFSGAIGAR